MIQVISTLANRWIMKQYKTFYELGEPLSMDEKEALRSYFDPDLLARTRKIFLDKIHPLDFLTKIRLSLLKFMFRIRGLAGLTLIDCVFLKSGFWSADPQMVRSILFHELVHVTQYDLLGSGEFIRRYFQSWQDNGFSYEKISFERVAYGLTHHYETFPKRPFLVKEKVLQGFEIR